MKGLAMWRPASYTFTDAALAPSLVNDPREVDAALRAVREIAGA
jgi:hypothetical protein